MVTGYWDKGSSSRIPENVKIVMSDGTRAMYRIDVSQPHPCFLAAMDGINHIIGYKAKHEKK